VDKCRGLPNGLKYPKVDKVFGPSDKARRPGRHGAGREYPSSWLASWRKRWCDVTDPAHDDGERQMNLLLADGKDFGPFSAKQVSIWGKVVRENGIKA